MGHSRIDRFFGSTPDAKGEHTKVVDQLVIHGGELLPGDLLERVVTKNTKYLVLDMDKTTHLGRNLGELLGWDVIAATCFGDAYLAQIEGSRGASRMHLSLARPIASLRYMLKGLRLWALPGLMYLLFGKIGLHFDSTRYWVFRRFGPEPVPRVQFTPLVVLLHHLAELPLDHLRRLARRLWERYSDDQVFTREDFDLLRKRHPQLKIIISSASPQPMLEIAKERLGADDAIYSAIEERDGYLSSPHILKRSFFLPGQPRRIAPPGSLHHNAGQSKMLRLLQRYPDFCDLDVETVGISDTSYGEDHSWANYFTRVVDVNSSDPFPPILTAHSPLKQIHSAKVLSRSERELKESGTAASHLDPRRTPGAYKNAIVSGERLRALVADQRRALERLSRSYSLTIRKIDAQRRLLQSKRASLMAEIDLAVEDYNHASRKAKSSAIQRLRSYQRKDSALGRELATLQRPLSRLGHRIRQELILSRSSCCHAGFPSPEQGHHMLEAPYRR
jgi:hypothetical protein